MNQIILVVGLPGAGKSMLLKGLRKGNWITFDDPKDLKEIESHLDLSDDKLKNIAIADPNFCVSEIRQKVENWFKDKKSSLWWVFFKNDPEKCKRNVELRQSKGDNRKVMGSIERFTKVYKIPEKATVIEIWQSTS